MTMVTSAKDKSGFPNVVRYHVAQSHGSTHFYDVIERAIWLLCTQKHTEEVQVYFHPALMGSTRSVLKEYLERASSGLSAKLCQLRRKVLGTLSASDRKLELNKLQHHNANNITTSAKWVSLFHAVWTHGQERAICIPEGRILLKRKKLRTDLISLLGYTRLLGKVIKAKQRIGAGADINFDKLFALDYCGIQIGDLVASTCLRKDPNAGGSLRRVNGMSATMLKAFIMVDHIRRHINEPNVVDYASSPEHSYLQQIYRRCVVFNQGKILENKSYKNNYQIFEKNELNDKHNPFVCQRPDRKLTRQNLEEVERYLRARIDDPSNVLWYMKGNMFEETEAFTHWRQNRSRPLKPGKVAIVFLHAFGDGQFKLGTDGSGDIYEWAEKTIQTLAAESLVDEVLVKPHPNRRRRRSADFFAIRRLKQKFLHNSKVCWLSGEERVRDLAAVEGAFGVTHHGSVAEELTFLGVPTIASCAAPWGTDFEFVWTWEDLKEFESIVRCIVVNYDAIDMTPAAHELTKFVYEYRIRWKNGNREPMWKTMLRVLDRNSVDTPNGYSLARRILENLRQDSPEFTRVLNAARETVRV